MCSRDELSGEEKGTRDRAGEERELSLTWDPSFRLSHARIKSEQVPGVGTQGPLTPRARSA